MELKTTVNQYESQNVRHERQNSFSVRSWNLEINYNYHQNGVGPCEQLCMQDTPYSMTEYNQQRSAVEENRQTSS
ncbi:unnamed protein product [Schistosoma mattheei]|uniref:Uncharacterized protein n=1 Tax=Schistosoma mattheei TaxID=31246 RepID=A0A183NKM3_9TREM|nr:unnamed protein product [Schistosoma mattheei]